MSAWFNIKQLCRYPNLEFKMVQQNGLLIK